MRDSEETSVFDLFFVQDVVVTPSVSANPDLDPANLGPNENLALKRNGALKAFLTSTATFEIYEEIMERVNIILEDKEDGDVAVEFLRQPDKRDLEESERNLLLTTFQKQNPEVVTGTYRAQTVFLNSGEEIEEFMTAS